MTQRSKYQFLWKKARKKKAQELNKLVREIESIRANGHNKKRHDEMAKKQARVDQLRHALIATS